jgi:hypothetical protein
VLEAGCGWAEAAAAGALATGAAGTEAAALGVAPGGAPLAEGDAEGTGSDEARAEACDALVLGAGGAGCRCGLADKLGDEASAEAGAGGAAEGDAAGCSAEAGTTGEVVTGGLREDDHGSAAVILARNRLVC